MAKKIKVKLTKEQQLQKDLKEELEFLELKTLALNMMIDLAEEKYNISIRPKESKSGQ